MSCGPIADGPGLEIMSGEIINEGMKMMLCLRYHILYWSVDGIVLRSAAIDGILS